MTIAIANRHLTQRLEGIQQQLIGAYSSSRSLSSATKGAEREAFIDSFLSQVLPIVHRFGTGDVTDSFGNKSGQLDVVIESSFAPSLPSVGGSRTRLYPAESVAAVVEVKSDIQKQWRDAVATADSLRPIRRAFGASTHVGKPLTYIPLFAVGYTGWKTVETVFENLRVAPAISGVLVIDAGIFVASPDFRNAIATGPASLWGLIASLHNATRTTLSASTDPFDYLVGRSDLRTVAQ